MQKSWMEIIQPLGKNKNKVLTLRMAEQKVRTSWVQIIYMELSSIFSEFMLFEGNKNSCLVKALLFGIWVVKPNPRWLMLSWREKARSWTTCVLISIFNCPGLWDSQIPDMHPWLPEWRPGKGKGHWTGNSENWVSCLFLPFTSCVISDKLDSLSGAQLPWLQRQRVWVDLKVSSIAVSHCISPLMTESTLGVHLCRGTL